MSPAATSQSPRPLRVGLGVFLVAAALLALIAVSSTPASNAASRRAPCTKSALAAGLSRGANAFPGGRLIHPFGCAGPFAFAAVIVHGNELTVVFRASGTRWTTINRARACNSHAVPSRIYKPACETN